jgi:hypothetical protein
VSKVYIPWSGETVEFGKANPAKDISRGVRTGLRGTGMVPGSRSGSAGDAVGSHLRRNRRAYVPAAGAAAGAAATNSVKKRGRGIVVPAGSSTSVRPLLPRGPHVSHENDLSVTTRRGQRRGSPNALARYSSGSQTQMTGGGQAYGHRARRVSKSFSTQQYAAASGTRGTPMSGLAQAGRIGRRLDVV